MQISVSILRCEGVAFKESADAVPIVSVVSAWRRDRFGFPTRTLRGVEAVEDRPRILAARESGRAGMAAARARQIRKRKSRYCKPAPRKFRLAPGEGYESREGVG
jgi:hypothetical protein